MKPHTKLYLTRAQTRFWSSEMPIGDPDGFGVPNDPVSALIEAGTSIVGGLLGSDASTSAANTQANAANQANQTQWNMFNTVNQQNAPWRQAGQTALGQLTAGTAPGGDFNRQFTTADLNSQLAPNYAFQLQQGQDAYKNMANLTGGMIGGNALQGLEKYTQDYAGNAYQNAFNNWNTQQSNIFNRLSNIAGLGGQANQTSAQNAATFGTNIGNNITSAGAAQAAGQVGSANAITGALNNAGSWYQLNKLIGQNNNSGNGAPSWGL